MEALLRKSGGVSTIFVYRMNMGIVIAVEIGDSRLEVHISRGWKERDAKKTR